MSQGDLVDNVKIVPVFDPGVYKSGSNATPLWVDTDGYESITVCVQAGATVTDTQTLALEFSANSNGSSPVAAVAGDLIGGATTLAAINSMTATTDNGKLKKAGVLQRQDASRYVSIALTGAGSTGAPLAAYAILGSARSKPVS